MGGLLPHMLAPLLIVVLCCLPAAAVNVIKVRSDGGVFDHDGVTPLQGTGTDGLASHIVQFLYAGPNATIQPPDILGLPTGDDQLIGVTAIGQGYPFNPNEGRFFDSFVHDLSTGARVYVRAWNSNLPGSEAKYGDSTLYSITNAVSPVETHDFGTWYTNRSVPGFEELPVADPRVLGLLAVVVMAAALDRVRRLVKQ